jgi:hypothetical protein
MSFGLIELSLVFGAVLLLAVWELRRTQQEIERDAKLKQADNRSHSALDAAKDKENQTS